MFEYLQQIDGGIYSRYLTVEKNIKAASNSFYDSYLNLQEGFLKAVVVENSINITQHESCGALLKRPDVKELFLSKYSVDEKVYEKMGDYTKKANEHKHDKEKSIQAETVVNYMHLFHKVSGSYATAKGLMVPQFDKNYFLNMFESSAKIDEKLEGIEEDLQKLLRAVAKPPQSAPVQSTPVRREATPVRQNDEQTLKNFIINSEKKYFWFGTKAAFKKSKMTLAGIQLAMIVVGILSTVISSVCFKLYSTFTLFENIVLIQMIILLSYTLKTKKLYGDYELAKHTSDIFIPDGDNIWRDSNIEKKKYKWLRRISYAAVVCNIICIWTIGGGIAVRVCATIFELAFLALTIATVFVRINHFCMYNDLFISGFLSARRVTIVHDNRLNRLYTLEDYGQMFPDFI